MVSDAEDTSSDDTFPQAKLVNGSYTWSGDAGGSGTGQLFVRLGTVTVRACAASVCAACLAMMPGTTS